MVDMSNGTFKVRVTGRATTDQNAPSAALIVDLQARELPEVRVLHRPGEPRPAGRDDVVRAAAASRPTAPTATARRAPTGAASRSSSPTTTRSTARCTPTTRACWSAARRSSDARRTRTAPEAKTDAIEVSGVAPGYVPSGGCPTRRRRSAAADAQVHDQRQDAEAAGVQPVAGDGGRDRRQGLLRQDDHPSQKQRDGRHQLQPRTGAATTTDDVPWPGNGVLYVKNNGACTGEIPTDADYDESAALRQRLRQRHLLQAAHDRGRQRRDHPPDRRRDARPRAQATPTSSWPTAATPRSA